MSNFQVTNYCHYYNPNGGKKICYLLMAGHADGIFVDGWLCWVQFRLCGSDIGHMIPIAVTWLQCWVQSCDGNVSLDTSLGYQFTTNQNGWWCQSQLLSSFNHNSCYNVVYPWFQNSFKMNIVDISTLYGGDKAAGKQIF